MTKLKKRKVDSCSTDSETNSTYNEINSRWLIRCFIVIGIPFYDYGLEQNKKIMTTMKLLLELFFTSFGVYLIYNSFIGFPAHSLFLFLTTAALTITLMTFRLSVAFKRSQILHMVTALKKFRNKHYKEYHRCTKYEIAIACGFIIGIPLITSFIFMLFLIQSSDEAKYSLKPNIMHDCVENPTCVTLVFPIYSSVYTLYYIITPSLCMTLFFFTYRTYENSLKCMLVGIHHSLVTNLTCQNIDKNMSSIIEATKVHQLIEDVLSPSIFLTYVLVFINFLLLVTINATEFDNSIVNLKTVGCLIMLAWSSGCFFHLTLIGAKLTDICNEWKYLQQNIVHNCTRKQIYGSDVILHLLLFNETSKLNLAFTGWGMFQLDRSLLLTMVGVIISYGVLIVTI
ncbi:uncharacterized protein CDAR_476721 [Caerostris darwini]|uniref:Odorant receptor n=1 Tax=Caerostris darwini TaxID=1538125 RepID=A0AAV4TZU1_9ARAC|nr:uncharacterized protein CDAR_476721 [Caerostris darwini]